jgi:hypothetical protein
MLDQIAAEAGVRLVCVQPLLVGRAREAKDFTRNKNDDSDAVIIARLATELRCYLPERAEPIWARLRHLGARRADLVLAAGAAGAQFRDLLECAWPAVLGAAVEPLESASWRAARPTSAARCGCRGRVRSPPGRASSPPELEGTASYVAGLTNAPSLMPSPHGAGRNHARTAARKLLTGADLDARMAGIACGRSDAFLDEHPDAYKDVDVVMADAADLVSVRHTPHQVVNVKGD